MIKFIFLALIIFLIILFWEKIHKFIFKKYNIKLNYIFVILTLIILTIILLLLNY